MTKSCRFIDVDYNTLFELPDGDKIQIDYPDGQKRTFTCKHIDEYHTSLNGECLHICQFAEKMAKLGTKYKPYVKEKDIER